MPTKSEMSAKIPPTVPPSTVASMTVQVDTGDDEEEVRRDTLYEITDLREYIARRVESDDVFEIKKFLKDDDYEFFKFEDPCVLFERCCFSLAISDVIEMDRIVAAAFFDDKSVDPNMKKYAKMWKNGANLMHLTPLNTFYMRLYAGSPEVQSDRLLTEIIAYTFSACHHVKFIIVELPDIFTNGYMFSKMVTKIEINLTTNLRKSILIYEKDKMFPPVKVREGREHDLDDLAPLLPMDNGTITREFGKAALSDIIALSDKNNQSMVAEWNIEAVGIISVSTDIDYEILNRFYHLEPFNGLYKPHSKDTIDMNFDNSRNMSDIPIDQIMKSAKEAMDSLKSKFRRRAPEKESYNVEEFRGDDDCGADYESDVSGALFDTVDANITSHQFGLKVSDDIIAYGLRSQSTIDIEGVRQSLTGCMDNLRTIAESNYPLGKIVNTPAPEDEDEHVEEEKVSEESLKNASETNLEDEGNVTTIKSKSNEEIENDQLMDFYAEFIDEDGEIHHHEGANNESDGNGDEMELLYKVENIEAEESEPEQLEEEEEQEQEEIEQLNVKAPSIEKIPVHHHAIDDPYKGLAVVYEMEKETPAGSNTPEQQEEEEMSEDINEDTLTFQGLTEKMESTKISSKKSTVAVSRKPTGKRVVPLNTIANKVSRLSRLSRSSRLSRFNVPVHGSSNQSLIPSEHQSMAYFVNREEFQKKLSQDTIYIGNTGTNRTFDEKVELMKKVWEVYQYMKDEGLTFEVAKMYLGPREIETIEEADMLTKGNLLRFFTALLPDEKLYPFERPIKSKAPVYYGLPNALAIKLFNIEKKFSLRSLDLFHAIFKGFPNREYLIVTVPQGSKEPAWLDHFMRVVPRRESSYPKELFVMHKAYLNSTLKVRRGRVEDIPEVIRLVSTLKDSAKMLEDFKRCVCCKTQKAFIVVVKNHPNVPIVGMAIASDEMESQSYHVNYDLDKHVYYFFHEGKDHCYVHHLILYPIFQRFSRLFLKEIMRMMDKTCMYQRIYPEICVNETTKHQTILNNLDDWIPLTPRKRVHYNYLNLTEDSYDLAREPPPFVTNYKDPYAVNHFAKKFTFDQKVTMNKRIVFVGASETSLSCIEKMISSSFKGYKRLTIIDPYGLPGQLPPDKARDEFFSVKQGGKSMSFESTAEWVQRLAIQNWTNVVIGWVTHINREKKYVVVNHENIVPYDLLILAPGQQFQRPDCPEAEIDDPNFIAFKKKTNPNTSLGYKSLTFMRNSPKPKNVFAVNTEVEADTALSFIKRYLPFMKRKKLLVFGGGLRAYACVKALLVFGIPPNRIVFITTPGHEVEWESKSGYILTDTVRVPMEKEFKILGIHIVVNYEFSHWETCSVSGLVKRTHFSSPTENDARISFSTFAFFSFRYRRVNDDLVSALAEAYILFQEGIIINENFKTNDVNILAAGPGTVYKRILLANHQKHQFYQSEEIGQQLADMILDMSGSEGGGNIEVNAPDVIPFKRPFVRAVVLVGDWYYMYIRSPGAPLHQRCIDPNGNCDESCECTTEIVTGSVNPDEDSTQRYFKVRLDDQSRIVGAECMSKKPFSASNLMGLYGQHEILLNKMMERLEKGETKDLYDHFCQPWYGVFCLDHWETFQNQLSQLYKIHDIGEDHIITDFIRDFVANLSNPESIQVDPNIIRNIWDRSGLKQEVELKFLDFLKCHRLALPMYARNDYVEDLLEERSTSNLYHPKVQQY